MQKVLIIQATMKHYRIPFFTGLHAALRRDGIELKVAYSGSNVIHALRKDSAELPPEMAHRVKGHWLFNRLLYQHLWQEIFSAELVIVGPEVKYVINPVLLLMSRLKHKRVAFWGLGPNLHPNRSASAEWVKQHFFTCVDWWFAYTKSVAEYLEAQGMARDKITVVQNATDTAELRRLMNDIGTAEMLAEKEKLTGSTDSQIGIYCGMLEEIKSIPLLIETARLVKKSIPAFHLVVIGNGPVRPWLEKEVSCEPWIHYLGSQYGRPSALYYKMSEVFMLAGTVGLAVVDAFAAGLPFLATILPTHPPEISYLRDGENGRLAPHNAEAFAAVTVGVLQNEPLKSKLRMGSYAAGEKYTMEAMVENYRNGVKRCLGTAHPSADAEGSLNRDNPPLDTTSAAPPL